MHLVEPRNVMYCTLEDGVADTIRNRLGKVDYVNLQNIYVMQGEKTDEGYTVPFNFTNQIDSFIEAVKHIKPALVVIDPLQRFKGLT